MKFRKLFSVIGLGLFAMATVGASAFALKNNEAKRAEAEAGDTWMFSVGIDASAIESAYTISNLRFHVWGTGVEKMVGLQEMGKAHYYAAILSFTDAQTVTGGQFVFYQYDDQNSDKYSIDLSVAAEDAEQLSKTENNGIAFFFTSSTDWTDGKWGASRKSYGWPYAQMTGGSKVTLTADPVNRRYFASDFVCDERYVDLLTIEWFNDGKSYSYLTTTAKSYSPSGSDNWVYLELGTYDVVIEHQFDDGGIINLIPHDVQDGYIYYVSASNEPTVDYIYSWGHASQSGSFPGTAILDLVAAGEAREITGNGVLHFQGGETAKLIYRINIKIGYPTGDTTFMFNNGSNSSQSDEREIESNCAYWWTGAANNDAANALGFLTTLEARRNEVADYSVCNIAKGNAQVLVNLYNSFTADQRSTYIDCSTVYTWTDKTKSANTLVTVRQIMERLSIIAEIDLVDASPNRLIAVDSSTMIIVLTVTAIGVISVSALVIFKKRKQN